MNHNTDEIDDSKTADRTVEVDDRPTTVRHTWEPGDQPCVAIVEAVAAATDRPTSEMPLLYQQIDTCALDALLTYEASSMVETTFTYADSTVSVSANGTIEIDVDSASGDEDSE